MLLRVEDVQEVLRMLEESFSPAMKRVEKVPLLNSLGRVLARDAVSLDGVPNFDKSVVDGYAVKSKDTFGAGESLPALMVRVGEVKIGHKPQLPIMEGECMYVPTGGMMPEGSDAVVMIENTEELDSSSIAVYKPVSPWENTIKAGEDIGRNETVVRKGTVIKPHHIGVLSSIGLCEVEVFCKPRVSIISTGDELVEPGDELKSGQIWDINSYSLAAAIIEDGGQPVLEGIVGDDREEIKNRVAYAVRKSDVVIISGGSSAGFRDFTADVINELGRPGVIAHGISIKPGKPTIVGSIGDKPVIGMPGQPVSSLVVYMVVVATLIRRLSGYPPKNRDMIRAVCKENYPSAPGREEYLMVNLEQRGAEFYASPAHGKSGMITTISSADGMVIIPKNDEGLYKGDVVEVILL